MKRILLLSLLLAHLCCPAQNYNCFVPGTKQFFLNANNYLRGMRIDSVRVSGSDIIYYPFHTPRGNYRFTFYPVLDTNGGSWLGKKVIQHPDGTFLFDNYWGDTVVIKTRANVGDTWRLYDDTTQNYYNIKVTAIDTMTVLGNLDSVKKMAVSAYKNNVLDTTDPANKFVYILSKNHGFVQISDMYMFPLHEPGVKYASGFDYISDHVWTFYPYKYTSLYNSIFKLTNFYNPHDYELKDYNIGEVFEYYENDMASKPYTVKTLDSIINVTSLAAGETEYTVHRWAYQVYGSGSNIDSSSLTFKTVNDTSSVNFLVDTSLMPEESGNTKFYYYYPYDYFHCFNSPSYLIADNFINKDSLTNLYWQCGRYDQYKIGFGRTDYNVCTNVFGYYGYYSKLTYTNKNNVTCGSFTPIVAVSNIVNNLSISVYPNPATNVINVKLPDNYTRTISMINILGQYVYQNSVTINKTIDVSKFPPGVYYMQIKKGDKTDINMKIVISH